MLYVTEIVCNQCGKKGRNDISLNIIQDRKTCKKCLNEREDCLRKEFCSEDCAIKFLKKYKNHNCREHIQYQFSDREMQSSVDQWGTMGVLAHCAVCDKMFTAEVKRGKKGCLKKILRSFGKS